ncbi:DUF4147 domain-containing protein [Candidatus Bathyarchaeota archaeon]|nr:DUF4147 domain-containing protein [Candidatus Bathyarchaeota archaeon]
MPRSDVCDIFEVALKAVDPEEGIYNALSLDEGRLSFEGCSVDLREVNKTIVIGGGKAGGLMAKAVENLLGDRIDSGIVNVLEGTENAVSLEYISLNGSAHPVPSESGVKGVREMLRLTQDLNKNDLVISLISGGGSALMPLPAENISLADLQNITQKLLKAGATINELNAVRKHSSSFKGGQLARHCYPAMVISLILSDVIGDPLDIIASGPTAPDASTFNNAQNVLEKYNIIKECPESIQLRIRQGVYGAIRETPKKNDPIFDKVHNILIANNNLAAAASKKKADELGYNSMILSTYIQGEARQVGEILTDIAREISNRERPLEKPAVIIIGGETTVTVTGDGVGGRNQELALAASMRLNGMNCIIATLGTDGIDGPTDAAGAIVDGNTMKRSNELGLDSRTYLEENDSYSFFRELGDAIITGPTGTNVNDLSLILVK